MSAQTEVSAPHTLSTRDAALTASALERFFTAGAHRASTPDHRELWAALQDAASGGKGLRPAIFFSLYRALDGRDEESASAVAAALELLHTAFVVHDDVIDRDTERRGRPNVSGTFTARALDRGHHPQQAGRYGESAAILAGDLALSGAVRLVARCGADPDLVARLLDHLDHALHLTAAGELADVRLSMDGDAGIGQAVEMEHQKTAVYSFELPLLLAAELAGCAESYGPELRDFARRLGIVYQLRDDLDGMFGDPAVTGKSTLSDLREGKCTPLIAHARSTSSWVQIRPFLGADTVDESEAGRVRLLLEQSGSRAYVEALAERLAAEARAGVAHLPFAQVLADWVHLVTVREPR